VAYLDLIGKVNDMTRFVDIDTFRKAADIANAYSIYTREAVKLWDENIDATEVMA
jgi:hypothetical protein